MGMGTKKLTLRGNPYRNICQSYRSQAKGEEHMTRNDIVKIMNEAGFNLSLRGHPDFPEQDNDGNLLFWTSGGNKEFQAIFAFAYEAGRKYENEVCAKEVDRWIGCDLLAAAIRARGQV